ncbi:MAG: ADP-forming succinate--CoA ligase subunit beta [Planctomycetota bacterium]|nr:ADP-forming succinate--CoA ligase subunit beta [Planctomycetota bacterium]
MKLHEHQAKELLGKFGVPGLRSAVVFSVDEAVAAFKKLAAPVAVLKAQVHAGGRGKAGGIKPVKSAEEAGEVATKLLGMKLVTHQTGPEGKIVRRLLLEEGCEVEREFYAAVTLDRVAEKPVVMVSAEGGVEIEEVARRSPEKIFREHISVPDGLQGFQVRKLINRLGIDKSAQKSFGEAMRGLVRAFLENDCSLAEINPLALVRGRGIVALDAKVDIDDRSLFRRTALAELRDAAEEDPLEAEAARWDLSYISLTGNIGCMVNGAGLAMATMDLIKLHGGEPANFLDVGGGASAEQVAAAFKLLLQHSGVRAVFINIFGGIMRCDTLANGMLAALKEVKLAWPLVIRLEGTNVDAGRKILKESGLKIIEATDMNDGARKAVAAVRN